MLRQTQSASFSVRCPTRRFRRTRESGAFTNECPLESFWICLCHGSSRIPSGHPSSIRPRGDERTRRRLIWLAPVPSRWCALVVRQDSDRRVADRRSFGYMSDMAIVEDVEKENGLISG